MSMAELKESKLPSSVASQLGILVDVVDGIPIVECGDGPRSALIALSVDEEMQLAKGVRLLVVSTDCNELVIVGVVRDKVRAVNSKEPNDCSAQQDSVVIKAKHDIQLQCGKSSIRLTKDGRVLIKGVDVSSRASQRNRLKGSTVAIN